MDRLRHMKVSTLKEVSSLTNLYARKVLHSPALGQQENDRSGDGLAVTGSRHRLPGAGQDWITQFA